MDPSPLQGITFSGIPSSFRFEVQCLPKNSTGLCLIYVPLHILGKQQSLLLELGGLLRNLPHISVVILIAFFEREPRITLSDALSSRAFKWYPLA